MRSRSDELRAGVSWPVVRRQDQKHLRTDPASEEEALFDVEEGKPDAFSIAESKGFGDGDTCRKAGAERDTELKPVTFEEEDLAYAIAVTVADRGKEKEEGISNPDTQSHGELVSERLA